MVITVLWVLVALGGVYWSIVSYCGIRASVALRRLADVPDDGPGAAIPSVTLVVAARDEAATLRHEAATFAAFDHPDLQLVLVNDRSSDDTGARMEQLAASDARIDVVHVDQLPDGWLGKVHALERGRELARGEWLLFTDADVDLAPDLPRRAVQWAEANRLDALALLPSVRSDGVLIAGAVATFSRWLVVGGRLWRAADPHGPDAFGVGACNLVRRSALERAGGLGWLRMDVGDDAALGQLIASEGGRTMLASGVGMVRVRWQESVRGMIHGFEKYGGTGGIGSIPAAIALASLATLGELAPWVALVVGGVSREWLPFGAAALLLLALTVIDLWVRRVADAPLRGMLAGPTAPLIVWWMQVRSAILEQRRGGVVWRDTFYSTAQLREGKRYHLR